MTWEPQVGDCCFVDTWNEGTHLGGIVKLTEKVDGKFKYKLLAGALREQTNLIDPQEHRVLLALMLNDGTFLVAWNTYILQARGCNSAMYLNLGYCVNDDPRVQKEPLVYLRYMVNKINNATEGQKWHTYYIYDEPEIKF